MIKILRFILLDKPSHIGMIDIQVQKWGNFIIYGCGVFQKNGHRWISFPSKKIEVPSGEVRYLPYNRFEDRAMQDKFGTAVIAALDQWLADGNVPEKPQKRPENDQNGEGNVRTAAPYPNVAYGPGSNGAYESEGVPF